MDSTSQVWSGRKSGSSERQGVDKPLLCRAPTLVIGCGYCLYSVVHWQRWGHQRGSAPQGGSDHGCRGILKCFHLCLPASEECECPSNPSVTDLVNVSTTPTSTLSSSSSTTEPTTPSSTTTTTTTTTLTITTAGQCPYLDVWILIKATDLAWPKVPFIWPNEEILEPFWLQCLTSSVGQLKTSLRQ